MIRAMRPATERPPSALAACLCLLLAAAAVPPLAAQEEPPGETARNGAEEPAERPLLALEEVIVRGPAEGKAPGAGALARLSVRIANRGERIASALAFTVEVEEQELPVYANQVFLKPIPAGETVEVALYNFWTGETGRPAPADGKLDVEVTLREARWMNRTVEKEGEAEVEVWSPIGPVEALPVTASTTITLSK